MLRVNIAIIDCFALADGNCASLIASLKSLSAEQPLPVICIVGPAWRFMQGGNSVNPHSEGIHLSWPISMGSLKRAITESHRHDATTTAIQRHRPSS